MAATNEERRRRRSDDTITALHYQLAHARKHAELEALVLVDASGALVAGAGSWPVCEELAAFAPLLSSPEAIRTTPVSEAVEALRERVCLKPISIAGAQALLAARVGQGQRADETLGRAATGCLRILGNRARRAPQPF